MDSGLQRGIYSRNDIYIVGMIEECVWNGVRQEQLAQGHERSHTGVRSHSDLANCKWVSLSYDHSEMLNAKSSERCISVV